MFPRASTAFSHKHRSFSISTWENCDNTLFTLPVLLCPWHGFYKKSNVESCTPHGLQEQLFLIPVKSVNWLVFTFLCTDITDTSRTSRTNVENPNLKKHLRNCRRNFRRNANYMMKYWVFIVYSLLLIRHMHIIMCFWSFGNLVCFNRVMHIWKKLKGQ